MTRPSAFEEETLLRILTQVRKMSAEYYANLMQTRGSINWRHINAVLAAAFGEPVLHEIQREAQRILLVRNGRIEREIEEMRSYLRDPKPIKCAHASCENLIQPGDWAFWPGGANRHAGFICEPCAVALAVVRRP